MAEHASGSKSIPGTYVKHRSSASEMAYRYIREWDEKRIEKAEKEQDVAEFPPTICISRKLAVGAVEIADLVAEKIGYRVVDQQILQHIATHASLSEKTVAIFDERYPGKLTELVTLAFGERAFIKSDYTKQLFSSVYAIAAFGPTIFVGRGVHLLLPRGKVLAVRIICSDNKKDASPYEFDLVINCDYIKEPRSVAEIILGAFREKFGLP